MIVGVDIGTQSLKAVVTTDDLQSLGASSVAYEAEFPRPGWAEQAPALWESALREAIAGALREAACTPRDVKALGIAGQLDGCVGIDAAGAPVGPCLIWMDRRATQEVAGLATDDLRRRCGITADPSHMAAKIAWLRRHRLGAAEATRFHQPVSYLVSRLTGEHVLDHAVASTTMLYGLETRGWDADLLERFGLTPELLPRIANAESAAGPLTREGAERSGLPQGIPVAVGTGDDFSSPLGAGLVEPGRLACVIGTAEVVGALDRQPKVDADGLVETHAYPASCYFIENPGWFSGGVVTWFITAFRLSGVDEFDALAEGVPDGADGLTFLPAMTGAMAPEWVASARGCFYGLTPSHGTAHMARAVLEGCAWAMRDVVERLQAMDVPLEAIRLLGGGARSRVWARIRSNASGLPVERPRVTDTSPLGAAMLAAVAGGLQPDLKACAATAGGVAETIEPDPAGRELCDAAYARYRRLFASLRPMFDAAQAQDNASPAIPSD